MPTKPSDSVVLRFDQGRKKVSKDLSGVVLMANKTLWLASDETRSVERLTHHDDRFERHRGFDLGDLLGMRGQGI